MQLDRALALAEEKFYLGDFKGSQQIAKEALKKGQDSELHYILIASYVQLGEYKKALEEIAKLHKYAPMHAGAFLQEIYIEKHEGRVKSEISHLRNFIAFLEEKIAKGKDRAYYEKFLAEAYSLLGSVLSLIGAGVEAVEAFLASSTLEKEEAQKQIEYSNALFAYNYLTEEDMP